MRFRQLLPLFGALLRCISFGAQPILSFGLAWKAAAVNDGGRSIPGSRYFIAGILLLRGHKLPPLRPLLNAALMACYCWLSVMAW